MVSSSKRSRDAQKKTPTVSPSLSALPQAVSDAPRSQLVCSLFAAADSEGEYHAGYVYETHVSE